MGVFINSNEGRLRAGWRLLIQLVGFFAVLLIAAVVASPIPDRAAAEVTNSVLYLAGGLGLAWLLARFIDKRRFADYGFHFNARWWGDLVFGLVLGVALMGGVVGAMIHLGWATLEQVSANALGVPIAAAFAIKLFEMTVVAINEELAFRGYQIRNLSEGFSGMGALAAVLLATLVSSSVFGVVHWVNELGGGEHTGNLATLNLIFAGAMLALPYLLTGNLGISIGLHITWNLFQGTVFGLPVSGVEEETHLLTVQQTGPELWTGGDYGPEGGLVATIAMLAGIVLSLIWIAVTRGGLKLQTEIGAYTPRA